MFGKSCLPYHNNNETHNNINKKKRKRNNKNNHDANNDDDNNDSTIIINFDNIQDGTSYLNQVVAEAKRLPDIFQASQKTSSDNNDDDDDDDAKIKNEAIIDGSAASLQYLISYRTQLIPPKTEHHAGSAEWVQTILNDFNILRTYLESCKFEHGIGNNINTRIPVPPMKDQESWHVFCVGYNDAFRNPGGYFDDDDDSNEKVRTNKQEDDNEIPLWRKNLPNNGYIPTVSLLLQMDQVMTRKILGYLIHYIVNENYTIIGGGQRAMWVYSLLARLEQPIHRNDAVNLFTLLKHLTCIRAEIKKDNHSHIIATINTLIAIIGIYFEQGGGYKNLMQGIR